MNIIAISDTHFGSSVALAQRHQLDDGGFYEPSDLQKKLWGLWENFWDFAYETVKGEPFVIVHNGDIIDGQHHRTTALSSGNLTIQSRLAIDSILPHRSHPNCAGYYQIRGTEAHVGQSAQEEEAVSEALGATPNEIGNFARWELWLNADRELLHFSHHIGHTSSSAYESSALRREMVAAYEDAGMWRRHAPTILVRGHTHRFIRVEDAFMTGLKLPAWQAKTPFTYKIDRLRGPMFGGVIIQTRPNDRASIAEKIYSIKQTEGVYLTPTTDHPLSDASVEKLKPFYQIAREYGAE